ncbi:MAG: hypothetical protein JXR90_10140, partial [Spirochaetes bacterium]|nr:hypothetical protein [Spirochaetota bacterium]
MKDKIRIDINWVGSNSDEFRLMYKGELSDYQKKRIGLVCKKEIDKLFSDLDRNKWQLRTFSFLPLLNLNEDYTFIDCPVKLRKNSVNLKLCNSIRKRFVENYWKPEVERLTSLSDLSFFAMILIPIRDGFDLFDDVATAFTAYKKMYSMIGEGITRKQVLEEIMYFFKKDEHSFVSDKFEDVI